MANESKGSPDFVWHGVELPRVVPGNYQAVCIGFQGPQWVRAFHRWSLRLEFSLLSGEGTVSAFFNMGNNESEFHIGRRSRFYRVWCMANGDTPKKGQRMGLDTFTQPGLIYRVKVEDASKDGKGESKPDGLVYSRVTEILEIEYRP